MIQSFLPRGWLRSLLFLFVATVPAMGEETLPRVVIGYYPSWTDRLPVSKIRFDQFTHLIHAFVTFRNGVLHTEGNLPSRELTRSGHAAGVKVLLGFGGADSGAELAALCRDPKIGDACVQDLAKLVSDNGYDGVDVDWEFPDETDAAGVVAFVDQLRQVLRRTNPAALVTMPLPNSEHYGRYFDGSRLARLLDLALIMNYNVHGPWKIDERAYCHAGFDAPLAETGTDPVDGRNYSYQKSVEYWRGKGFTNQQLVAGMHLSGHGFMVAKWGETPVERSPRADIEYREIEPLLNAGWKRKWDQQASVPWLESPPGLPAELITYDDRESVALKGAWARQAGVRGIFFWEISEDFIQGHNELVEAGRKGLGQP